MTKRTLSLLVLILLPIAAGGPSSFGCSGPDLASLTRTSTGGQPGTTDATSLGGAGTDSLGPEALGGAGNSGGTSSVASGTGGASTSSSMASSSTTTAQAPISDGGCSVGHLLIGEIRSRGAGGATDEFVALFNATPAPVVLDATWTLEVRGTSDTEYRAHWKGTGDGIPAFGHYLVAGAGYAQVPAADAALSIGIPDAAGIRLVHAGTAVDAVCYAYNASTQAAFDATFTCEGTPASNLPHNNTAAAASDVDASIARRPGGALGSCADTGDNGADFVEETPATPMSTASPPAQ